MLLPPPAQAYRVQSREPYRFAAEPSYSKLTSRNLAGTRHERGYMAPASYRSPSTNTEKSQLKKLRVSTSGHKALELIYVGDTGVSKYNQ